MYKKTQALDKTRDIRFTELNTYHFAAQEIFCPVFLQELPYLVREYFICFPDNRTDLPHVLLGYEQDSNLYVSSSGIWLAEYIPLYIRRYPFILGRVQGKPADEVTLAADIMAPHFKQSSGEPLFYPDGQPTPILHQKIDLLKSIENDKQATQQAVREIDQAGLFTNKDIRGASGSVVKNLRMIDRDQLPYSGLHPGPALEMAYAHLFSRSRLEYGVLAGRRQEDFTPEFQDDDILHF